MSAHCITYLFIHIGPTACRDHIRRGMKGAAVHAVCVPTRRPDGVVSLGRWSRGASLLLFLLILGAVVHIGGGFGACFDDCLAETLCGERERESEL